jgi:Xaa-Pro dipeptidase
MQTQEEFRKRIEKAQEAMKEFGLGAIVLEPGPAMTYLTGVRWGKSERSFLVVIPAKGEPAWVLPGFEEMRARELIQTGSDIRIWQEDESSFERVALAFSFSTVFENSRRNSTTSAPRRC